jgi:transposase
MTRAASVRRRNRSGCNGRPSISNRSGSDRAAEGSRQQRALVKVGELDGSFAIPRHKTIWRLTSGPAGRSWPVPRATVGAFVSRAASTCAAAHNRIVEEPTVSKVRSWVGVDVHAASVVACCVDAESGELSVCRLGGETAGVVAFCAGLPAPVRVAYEAGPTGFGLARALLAAGIGCVVAAPGKIERAAQDRVKTDRRDAERLVRLLMIGALHAVRVPTPEEEALRDLVRAREDLRGDLMRARHRLSKFLLRHDVRFEDTTSRWGQRHRQWLGGLELGEPGAQLTLGEYVGSIDQLQIRRDTLEAAIEELVPSSPWAQTVARLRCLRGVDTLTAVGLCAEVGTFERFEHPRQLMSYLGLVPSEHSSGQTRRQGAITRSGSQHARRLLVEAAWHYRRVPRLGTRLQRRQHNQEPAVIAIAWKAQQRLHRIWRRLEHKRGKRKTIIAVAVARQLAGFCWAIATHREHT